jgi:hypothetical protein
MEGFCCEYRYFGREKVEPLKVFSLHVYPAFLEQQET